MPTETDRIISMLEAAANAAMSLEQIIAKEVKDWKASEDRKWMLAGHQYYKNETDILKRVRQAVGENGELAEVKNLANNKLVHGFIRKLVDQKIGYLLSKVISVQTKEDKYLKALNDIFDKSFLRFLKNAGKDAINKGKAWAQVHYTEDGKLAFKLIPSEELIPLWRDSAHTDLDAMIRVFEVETYEGTVKKMVTKVQFWDRNGVRHYVMGTADSGMQAQGLIVDVEAGGAGSHFSAIVNGVETGMNWERVPFICFKYNDEELPLVRLIKSLVDEYDRKKSDNSNNLEDLPNSIYVLKNYDGQNLGEFRRNISMYRAVKVSNEGGVDTLDLTIDTEAFKTHMEMTRKNIYEFGRGVDTQSDKFGNSPSGIALRFLYADLDMDANMIETEFQASLEQLLWFVDRHLANSGVGDFSSEPVEFIFNRDIIINESDTINNVKSSVGIVSDETLLANHPWVTDVQEEIKRIQKQQQEDLKKAQDYAGLGGNNPNTGGDGSGGAGGGAGGG